MTAPSNLTVSYPLSFTNSFWSWPDYRRGAASLYSKLQAGIDENTSILALVSHRTEIEYNHAEALATPPPNPTFSNPLFKEALSLLTASSSPSQVSRGFSSNASAASHAFRAIEAEITSAQASAHGKVANNLEKLILNPFGKWAEEHKLRVSSSWEHVDASLQRFEKQKAEVERLRNNYESKCRQADEAEDDARFAPVTTDEIPASPAVGLEKQTPASIDASSSATADEKSEGVKPADPERLKRRETLRKQFGFGNRTPSEGHRPSEFAGVRIPSASSDKYSSPRVASNEMARSSSGDLDVPLSSSGDVSLKRAGTLGSYLSSAVGKMGDSAALKPLKAAVGGLAEPRHIRLRREADAAEKSYEESVRSLDRTRCAVEEILFEHYTFAQRWETDRVKAVKAVLMSYNAALSTLHPSLAASFERSLALQKGFNPERELRNFVNDAQTGPFRPAPEVFHPYYHDEAGSQLYAGAGGFGIDLVAAARADALARQEDLSKDLPATPGSTLSSKMPPLPPVLHALLSALERAYHDSNRWPSPPPTEDSPSTLLVQSLEKRKSWIYEVPLPVTHRLRDVLISQLSSPQPGGTSAEGISDAVLDAYDPPVLASVVKLWALELGTSLLPPDTWDLVYNLYAAAAGQEKEALEAKRASQTAAQSSEVTANDDNDKEGEPASAESAKEKGKGKEAEELKIDEEVEKKIREGVIEDLCVVLAKLPQVHLTCLDAIIHHLHKLLKDTKTDEPDIIFLNKLGLSIGRALIRPRFETARTISARHPTLLAMDLVQYYDRIFPDLLARKARESDLALAAQRRMPIRKRTKPVDQRISRSSIGRDVQEGHQLLAAQYGSMHASDSNGSSQSPEPSLMNEAIRRGASPIAEEDERDAEKKRESMPRPTIDTSAQGGVQKTGEEIAPTPISQRVLSVSSSAVPTDSIPIAEEKGQTGEPSSEAEAKTAKEDIAIPGPAATGAAPAVDGAPAPASANSTSKGTVDEEDKPLSNVARLSRQFGSSGGPRGPRPAGARGSRVPSNSGGASITPGVKEEP
ncbi:hypothetical protein IE53DRAFT_398827 [Violaceomyces palustris]|uniref:Uncharacterized protein n=1 Tax=Violaceomyces palustris TaxID=1673888 RepID=A0ACD0NSY6_9BASI|nr:hypothetical protein IE53DRAFT_398827 [Violaceomyces palustris]